MYLSKLQEAFVWIANRLTWGPASQSVLPTNSLFQRSNYICLNCRVYLSPLQNVFVQIPRFLVLVFLTGWVCPYTHPCHLNSRRLLPFNSWRKSYICICNCVCICVCVVIHLGFFYLCLWVLSNPYPSDSRRPGCLPVTALGGEKAVINGPSNINW